MAEELTKLGVTLKEHPDGLTIAGGVSKSTATLSPRHDHRLAMAFASLAPATDHLVIEQPSCVGKTFPDFWRLGVALYRSPRPR